MKNTEGHQIELPTLPGRDPVTLALRGYAMPERGADSVASGDFNGDGVVDVALAMAEQGDACEGRSYVRVLFGSHSNGLFGGPAFPYAPELSGQRSAVPRLSAGDLDEDGSDELIAYKREYSFGPNTVRVLSVSQRDIEVLESYDFGERQPSSVAVGNFDGTRGHDLFVTFSPGFTGDVENSEAPSAVFMLAPAKGTSRVELAVPAIVSQDPAVVVMSRDGHDAIRASVHSRDYHGGAAFVLTEVWIGDEGNVVVDMPEHEWPLPPTPGIAVDMDGDAPSELVLTIGRTSLVYQDLDADELEPLTSEALINAAHDPDVRVSIVGVLAAGRRGECQDSYVIARRSVHASRESGFLSLPFDCVEKEFGPTSELELPFDPVVILDDSLSLRALSSPAAGAYLLRSGLEAEDRIQRTLWALAFPPR